MLEILFLIFSALAALVGSFIYIRSVRIAWSFGKKMQSVRFVGLAIFIFGLSFFVSGLMAFYGIQWGIAALVVSTVAFVLKRTVFRKKVANQ